MRKFIRLTRADDIEIIVPVDLIYLVRENYRHADGTRSTVSWAQTSGSDETHFADVVESIDTIHDRLEGPSDV